MGPEFHASRAWQTVETRAVTIHWPTPKPLHSLATLFLAPDQPLFCLPHCLPLCHPWNRPWYRGHSSGTRGNTPSFKALSFPRVVQLLESPVAFRRDGLHLVYNLSALVKRSVLSQPLTSSLHNWRCPLFRPFARVLKKHAYFLATHAGHINLKRSMNHTWCS